MLLQIDKPHDVINRTQPKTKVDRTSLLLVYKNIDVAVSGLGRSSIADLHVVKVVQVLETALCRFKIHGVEILPRKHRDLTTDHPLLTLGISLDTNIAHFVTTAWSNTVENVHPVSACISNIRNRRGISITSRSVITPDHTNIVAHFTRGKRHIRYEGQSRIEFCGSENLDPGKADRIHGVFWTFLNRNHEINPSIFNRYPLGDPNFDPPVSPTAVKISNLFQILIKRHVVDSSGLCEPRKPTLLLCLHLLAEVSILQGIISLETNLANLVLGSLLNEEDEVCKAGALRRLKTVRHSHIRVAIALVKFLDVLSRGENILITKNLPDTKLSLIRELLV